MLDQLFESFRTASESTMKAQQEMMKQWLSNWPAAGPNAAGISGDWNGPVKQRWMQSATEALNRQRQLLDSMYESGIRLIEQSFRVTDAKSPEDYRQGLEELWGKMSETIKEQSEAQFREFRSALEKWSEVATPAKG